MSTAPTWQPIETAPKNGTEILLCSGGRWKSINIGHWVPVGYAGVKGKWHTGFTCADEGDFDIDSPTHWQPLPEPPRAALSGRKEGS